MVLELDVNVQVEELEVSEALVVLDDVVTGRVAATVTTI